MLEIVSKIGSQTATLNLPTSLSEITPNYLYNVTKDVVICQHYALIALCVNDKLSVLCSTKQKEATVNAVAMYVRSNNPNENDYKPATGSKIVAAPTDIMRGFEIVAPNNVLRPSFVTGIINSDPELLKTLFSYTQPVWLVTFKLVPLNEIHGYYVPELVDNNVVRESVMQYYTVSDPVSEIAGA